MVFKLEVHTGPPTLRSIGRKTDGVLYADRWSLRGCGFAVIAVGAVALVAVTLAVGPVGGGRRAGVGTGAESSPVGAADLATDRRGLRAAPLAGAVPKGPDRLDVDAASVERGLAFNVCLDWACESLDEAVREAFDREWACPEPDCDGDLRILRRGGLIAGCEHYPDCDTGFAVPAGVVDGECGCGLPTFETRSGTRCLDATCDQGVARALEADSAADD